MKICSISAKKGKHTVIISLLLVIAIVTSTVISTVGFAENDDYIKWVDFKISYTVLRQAMQIDIDTYGSNTHIDWILLLAVAACYNGGSFEEKQNDKVNDTAERIKNGENPDDIIASLKYCSYYYEAYSAVLGGFLGEYQKDGNTEYGLIAYSPVAYGYSYSHSDDFGNSRSYGFKRTHLGNDLMGSIGTPIIAVEDGIIENMGWNKYGGWRIGIRSMDFKRYYYYAHLRKGHPYVNTLKEGMTVKAGDVIGYLGMTGYSDNEDYNGMNVPHLHFGVQLIFDESQVESNNEIWIDVYKIVKLLSHNRSHVVKNENTGDYERTA